MATLLALGLCACTGPDLDNRFDLSAGEGSEETAGSTQGESDGGEEDAGSSQGDGDGDEDQEAEGGEPPSAELLDIPSSGEDAGNTGEDEGPPSDDESGACLDFTDVLAPVPPSVLFVLDRSGSMMEGDFDDEDFEKTRWNALYESVEGVLMQEQFDSIIEFGAKTFSTKGWGECGVSPEIDVDFALGNGGLILDELPGPNAWVNGGTPTQDALAVSLDYMRSYEAEGSKAVILVTDGSIGCTDDSAQALSEITSNIASARDDDAISTFVVGIAPKYNSTRAQLEAMAVAGGSSDYFEASDATALSDALSEVIAASYAGSCYLQLDEAPNFPDLVEVEVDGQYWDELDDCGAEDGWTWDNDQLTRMRLCNAACDALIVSQEANVEFHCNAG